MQHTRLTLAVIFLALACHDSTRTQPAVAAGSSGAVSQPIAGASGGVAGQAVVAGAPAADGGKPGSQSAPIAGAPTAVAGASGGGAGAGSSGGGGTVALAAGASGGAAGQVGAAGTPAAGSGAPQAGSSAPVAAACTGKPGKQRGKSTQRLMAGGQQRSFVYYAPQSLAPDRPVPLLIVPHGYTQSGEQMFEITKYPAIADREGFVVMFPDGAPNSTGPWDVGSGVCGNGALVPGRGDDQAFIDGMIAFAAADQCIDREHVFMSGWSMGGYLSHHSGCLRDDIRAIGPHSGGTHDLAGCKAKHKPVIMFHFDPDGLIDYSCGTRARDAWIERNGCQAADPEVKAVKGGSCAYYKGCPADGQVAFCSFEIPSNHRSDFLAGHAWSGGAVHSYSIAETESAAELAYRFFKTYAW